MLCQGCGAASPVNCTCARIRVFGRMTPQQKIQVVRRYAGVAMTVGMCGDGGNDSGALRAAHAGLSLGGSAEASVAAPFSTDAHSLGALVLLMREGRASLCTSFAAYRFLVVRGIVWTQAKNVMLLMSGLYLAPLAYLFIDLLSVSILVWAITQVLVSLVRYLGWTRLDRVHPHIHTYIQTHTHTHTHTGPPRLHPGLAPSGGLSIWAAERLSVDPLCVPLLGGAGCAVRHPVCHAVV